MIFAIAEPQLPEPMMATFSFFPSPPRSDSRLVADADARSSSEQMRERASESFSCS